MEYQSGFARWTVPSTNYSVIRDQSSMGLFKISLRSLSDRRHTKLRPRPTPFNTSVTMLGGASSKNIRVYWLAFVVYLGILLFGYGTSITGGVVSQHYFETHFGLVNPDGTINKGKDTEISSNVVSVFSAGGFFGAIGSAPISNWLGRRRTLVILVVIFCLGAILTTVAGGSRGVNYIYAGRIVCGLGIGGISAVSPTYVSESSPKGSRGHITGVFQIMLATGTMVAYFVNLGVGLHLANSENVWRVPLGLQLVPAGIMCLGLFTVKESPRWLASKGRTQEAIMNLAYFRREPHDSPEVRREMVEIEAAIREERAARKGLGLREAFFGKGNFIRFSLAIVLFTLHPWSGQNSVTNYAPQIFSSIGYTGTKNSLLSSGIYCIFKVVATAATVFFLVETLGRRMSLFMSAMGMGVTFFIIGAILKTHPLQTVTSSHIATPSSASQAMAAMLYIYVCFYGMGVGPIPWIYVSEIFPTRTRHYGLAVASAIQWIFNYVVAKITPTLVADLGYKLFFVFAAIDIGGIAVFAIFLPETKGRSLEEMDIIFGAVSYEAREAFIEIQERELKNEFTDIASEYPVHGRL
ncbi:general substrate transporter [Scleroderma citrinum]